MKKQFYKKLHTAIGCLVGTLIGGFLSCSDTVEPDRNEEARGGWLFTVAEPEIKNQTHGRALFPLGPEMENPIKTLALMIFDAEGQHLIEDADYFAYRQVANHTDAPDGKLVVYEPDYGQFQGTLPHDTHVTMCVMANVQKEQLLATLRGASTGVTQKIINLDQFKKLMIDIPYYEKIDSIGLVKNIYMFGYYEGKLVPNPQPHYLKVSLGRIISRINISVSLSPALAQLTNVQYAFRLLNVENKAYVFPGNQSPSTHDDDPYYHIEKLSERPTTFYHYVGPHSAQSANEATQVEIAYGTNLPSGPIQAQTYQGKKVSIAICNDPPTITENVRDFWLNRNTVYNISIHLKKRGERTPASRSLPPHTQVIEIEP